MSAGRTRHRRAHDHRSLKRRASSWSRKAEIGAPAKPIEDRDIEGQGIEATAPNVLRDRRGNGARIIADPSSALDAITDQQSTFTHCDMAKFAHRHSDGIES